MNYDELLPILHEDNHVIVVDKPCGWPTTHFDGVDETVDRLVKAYLKEKYGKPGNVFLGVVHRLDKPVGGCLLFARTSKAAARLSEQFRSGGVEKVYHAVVENGKDDHPVAESGYFDDALFHDEDSRIVRVVAPGIEGAKMARTAFQVLARTRELSLFELRPHTGRKHQLRVQLASRGMPIVGDQKYGSRRHFGHAIALYARSLTFLHPTKGEPITVTAPLPKSWRGPFAELLRDRRDS